MKKIVGILGMAAVLASAAFAADPHSRWHGGCQSRERRRQSQRPEQCRAFCRPGP